MAERGTKRGPKVPDKAKPNIDKLRRRSVSMSITNEMMRERQVIYITSVRLLWNGVSLMLLLIFIHVNYFTLTLQNTEELHRLLLQCSWVHNISYGWYNITSFYTKQRHHDAK